MDDDKTLNAAAPPDTRRRAEEELLRAKDALERRTDELAHSLAIVRATLESTADGILVTDRDGRIIGCNENFVRMWGLGEHGLLGTDHGEVLQATSRLFADAEAFMARTHAIDAQTADAFDVLELADGRVFERFSRVQSVPARRAADEPVEGARGAGRVWSFRDITERRRAEEALHDEARVLDLLNKSGSAIASTLDLDELGRTVTDAATQISGAELGAFFPQLGQREGEPEEPQPSAVCGMTRDAFHAFGDLRSLPLLAPVFAGVSTVRHDDVASEPGCAALARPTEGVPALRSCLAVPVLSRVGEAVGALVLGHSRPQAFDERSERLVVGIAAQAAVALDNARLYDDVRHVAQERERLFHAERAARADAERISRMKDEFLATLSHELRTPLTAILGWAKVLLRRADPENLQRGLQVIERNARAQSQLIEDLLDMNRIVSGRVHLETRPVDLVGAIEAALESVRPAAEAKEIRLTQTLDPLAGPVAGDPARLQQIVWNLLSNAVKFTPRGGAVDLRLQRREAHVEISVADTGMGIAADFLPLVFDRFRQADSSTTRRHGGLGIGLSIVKHLVELHGGSVRATSEGEGRGATFHVQLPAIAALAPAPAPAVAPELKAGVPAEMSLSGVHVLVVDDEPDARELIRQVLVEVKADVVTAASANEGLALVEKTHPDVVVSDIGMPGVDGYEFIRELRRRAPAQGGRTPAIALTAFARSEDRTRAMFAGYQMHIAKPIEPQELVATVGSLTGRTGSIGR